MFLVMRFLGSPTDSTDGNLMTKMIGMTTGVIQVSLRFYNKSKASMLFVLVLLSWHGSCVLVGISYLGFVVVGS